MKQAITVVFAILLSLIVGCAKSALPQPPAVVYQNSTIDALFDGNYDGDVTFSELAKHGDFGLGTLDALDGEMVALSGHFYQIRSDGHVYEVPTDAKTPFAVVTFFRPAPAYFYEGRETYAQLKQQMDAMRRRLDPQESHAFAFRVRGRFWPIRTRSVPRQEKPYPPLAEVVKTQLTFETGEIDGTMFGFWFPESMRHVNVPGYHFHFLSSEHTMGGHVLDLEFRSGFVDCQELSTLEIAFPSRAPTTRAAVRASDEMEKVEK